MTTSTLLPPNVDSFSHLMIMCCCQYCPVQFSPHNNFIFTFTAQSGSTKMSVYWSRTANQRFIIPSLHPSHLSGIKVLIRSDDMTMTMT